MIPSSLPLCIAIASAEAPDFNIGHTQGFLQSRFADATEDLGDEGYSLQVDRGNRYLTGGRRRGPINAVLALLEDFALHYYGKAGPVMIQYDELLRAMLKEHEAEMRRPEGGRRFSMTAALYSPEFLDRAAALLAEAERLGENDAIRQRIGRVERTIAHVKAAQREAR